MTRKWSEAFGYSTMGTAVWTDRLGLGEIEGPPGGSSSGYLSGSSSWRAYADGGWHYYGSFTFGDRPQDGERIYGWATLRFLCAVNGIEPPRRRLRGEPFLPVPELVVAAVWDQVTSGDATLQSDYGPSGMPDHEGTAPLPIEALGGQARAFWVRLRELHVERRLLPRGVRV